MGHRAVEGLKAGKGWTCKVFCWSAGTVVGVKKVSGIGTVLTEVGRVAIAVVGVKLSAL